MCVFVARAENVMQFIVAYKQSSIKNYGEISSHRLLLTLSAGISSRDGNVIVIREAPTTSSSESNFTDPESPVNNSHNLTITKLEQLDLISELPKLQIVRHENVSLCAQESTDEMPIVKKSETENGGDKGIFSVSRVKKVELSEISLATRKFISHFFFVSENSLNLFHLTTFPSLTNDSIKQ